MLLLDGHCGLVDCVILTAQILIYFWPDNILQKHFSSTAPAKDEVKR